MRPGVSRDRRRERGGDLGAEDTASNIDEQRDSASNTERKTESDLFPDQDPYVGVLLYCFKQSQTFSQIRTHMSAFSVLL